MGSGDPKNTEETRVSWHPAFFEAMRLELEPYRDQLEFNEEYQLTSEPLRVDLLIIKKPKDLVIAKNIAAIFRGTNIIEYKSPSDYVSVGDYYKVYAYACLCVSLKKVPMDDITITFVGNRRSRALMGHLRWRGLVVEKKGGGIYTVTGEGIPVQIIESRELPGEENGWLRDLGRGLKAEDVLRVSEKIERLGKAGEISAYVEALFRANSGAIREAMSMSEAAVTLEKVFEEAGLISKWETRGEARGEARGITQTKIEVAKNLIMMGLPLKQVAKATGLDIKTLKSLEHRNPLQGPIRTK
jgi:hypothetical protein